MNILGATDQVLLNLSNNQQKLTSLSSHLASGLRIESAADDPSGNSIAQGLQAKINGLQQSVENVQEGNNLLTVADGAAASIQSILQRINSLIIESNSDINSNAQLEAIQTEINQELLEINRISENANFNGVTLFNGSHDTSVVSPNANVTFVEINPGNNPDGTTPITDSASNPEAPAPSAGFTYNGQLIQNVTENNQSPYVGGLFILQVQSSTTPGTVNLNQILYSNDTAFDNGKGSESIIEQQVPTGDGFDFGGSGPSGESEFLPSGAQDWNFDIPNLSAGDVDVAMGVGIITPKTSGGGTAININDGGDEGTTIAISLPSLSTNALQISDITVLRPTQVAETTTPTTAQGAVTGVDQSNQYAAMYAQFVVGQALEQVAETRAQLGAQMVSTQEDANNDNIAGINYTSSQSSIADLNVGTAVTQFTQTQILNSVGSSVLSQMQISAKALTNIMLSGI